MSPADVYGSSSVVRSRDQLIRDRRRRQTYTFLTVVTVVMLIGLVALGNWQQWWTIGGGPQAAVICPEPTVTEPRFTNVNVINGTETKGLAAAVAKELQKRQFKVLTIASEELDKPLRAVVEVRYGPAGELSARTVSLQFPAKVVLIRDDREDVDVDVIIGEKYKGMVNIKKGLAAIEPAEEPRGCVRATSTPSTPEPSAS